MYDSERAGREWVDLAGRDVELVERVVERELLVDTRFDVVVVEREPALRARRGVAHRAIGDRGYRGEAAILSTPSSQDTEAVREFKGRVLSRQETFNSRLKHFNCLDERFRHGIEKHKWCFYACAVIVQLQLENGFPLFQV